MARTTGDPRQGRIRQFDDFVDHAFDRLRGHPAADRCFYGASAIGDHSLIWLIAAAAGGLRPGQGHTRAAVRTSALIMLESLLVNAGIKTLFRRQRPIITTPHPLPLRVPLTSSFPSGHATSAFCAAALLTEGDPALGPVFYATAVVVAASRVYVKIHHASDVVAGIAVGATLGALAKRCWPR